MTIPKGMTPEQYINTMSDEQLKELAVLASNGMIADLRLHQALIERNGIKGGPLNIYVAEDGMKVIVHVSVLDEEEISIDFADDEGEYHGFDKWIDCGVYSEFDAIAERGDILRAIRSELGNRLESTEEYANQLKKMLSAVDEGLSQTEKE